MNHDNSTKSYEEQRASGKIEIWRRKVFAIFSGFPKASFTDREIIETTWADDVNLVRPEITRLLKDGLIVEVGKTRCPRTGRTVRCCTWTGKEYFNRNNKLGASNEKGN